MDFKGKIAVVTGAGGGIGRATAVAFAQQGAALVVVDRDEAAAAETMAAIAAVGGKATGITADVTRAADVAGYVEAALSAHGRIDCFFNNAGIEGAVVPTQEYDDEVFDQVMAVNVKGVYLGLRHVLPVMVRQGSGAVVNTSSIAGLHGAPGMPAYVASKHAVLGLTKVGSTDVAGYGVRVNAVCPGPVETRMMRSLEAQRNPANPDAVAEAMRAAMPSGRYTMPEEVANIVLFLCSDGAANITGTHLVVDGGRTGANGTTAVRPQARR